MELPGLFINKIFVFLYFVSRLNALEGFFTFFWGVCFIMIRMLMLSLGWEFNLNMFSFFEVIEHHHEQNRLRFGDMKMKVC